MRIRLIRQLMLATDDSGRVSLSDVEQKLRDLGSNAQSLATDAAPPMIGGWWPPGWSPWLLSTCWAAGAAVGGLRCSRSVASDDARPGAGLSCVAISIVGRASWCGAAFGRA